MKVRTYPRGKTKKGGYPIYEVELLDLGKPEIAGGQLLYPCPFCFDEKKDKKLYYNTKDNIGFCHRCEIVIYGRGGKRIEKLEANQFTWINYIKSENGLYDISWAKNASLFPDAKQYLLNRKVSYDDAIINQYNIRAFEVYNNTGIVLPNNFPGQEFVDSFQVTFTRRNPKQHKYITYSSDKSIYFLFSKLDDESIILVEGIFDAIASYGCALLGKAMSKSQLKQLYQFIKKSKRLKNVFVVLDGEVERARKVATGVQVKKISSSVGVYYTDLPDHLDPEEAVAAGVFDECLNKSQRIFK